MPQLSVNSTAAGWKSASVAHEGLPARMPWISPTTSSRTPNGIWHLWKKAFRARFPLTRATNFRAVITAHSTATQARMRLSSISGNLRLI